MANGVPIFKVILFKWGVESPIVRVQRLCSFVLCPMILSMEKDSTSAMSLALPMVSVAYEPSGPAGGCLTIQSCISQV